MTDMRNQRDIARRLGQTEVKEVPGGIAGFTSFYATGTFVPTLFGSGTAGTFTYNAADTEAVYTRLGNEVFIEGRVIISATAVAPTGNVSIGGLPFVSAAATNSGNIAGIFHTVWSGINLQAGYTYVAGVVVGSVSSAFLYECGDNVARAIVQGGEMSATFDIFFSGHYRVA
jgi:hypothetical protein